MLGTQPRFSQINDVKIYQSALITQAFLANCCILSHCFRMSCQCFLGLLSWNLAGEMTHWTSFLPAIKRYWFKLSILPTAFASTARNWNCMFQYLSSCCLQMLYSLHPENKNLENASMQLHPENFRSCPCLSKMSLPIHSSKYIWAIEDTKAYNISNNKCKELLNLVSVK